MLTGGYGDLLCWYQRNLAHEDWLAAGCKHERHRHLVVDVARSLAYKTTIHEDDFFKMFTRKNDEQYGFCFSGCSTVCHVEFVIS